MFANISECSPCGDVTVRAPCGVCVPPMYLPECLHEAGRKGVSSADCKAILILPLMLCDVWKVTQSLWACFHSPQMGILACQENPTMSHKKKLSPPPPHQSQVGADGISRPMLPLSWSLGELNFT